MPKTSLIQSSPALQEAWARLESFKSSILLNTTNTQTTSTTNAPNSITLGQIGNGSNGKVLATNAKATFYDPALGGINASGAKTKDGLPATSTGEGYKPEIFSAAAFPELLRLIQLNIKQKPTTS